MLYALVQRRYFARSREWHNEFAQQTDSYQAHDGSVTVGTTPEVRYNDYPCGQKTQPWSIVHEKLGSKDDRI